MGDSIVQWLNDKALDPDCPDSNTGSTTHQRYDVYGTLCDLSVLQSLSLQGAW